MSAAPQYETNYDEKFRARDYLNQYFQVVDQTNANLLKFVMQVMQREDISGTKVINFGCGPCIDTIISIAPSCAEIHMSDYLDSNLQEIREWLAHAPDAFNWDHFVRSSLQLEAELAQTATDISAEHIAERNAIIRQKITQLMTGDAKQAQPLGAAGHQQYDVLVMFFCLEAAAADFAEWQRMVQNVMSLLKPNGLIIWVMTALQTEGYQVGTETFQVIPLKEADIKTALTPCIKPNSLQIDYFDVIEHDLIQGAFLVTARASA